MLSIFFSGNNWNDFLCSYLSPHQATPSSLDFYKWSCWQATIIFPWCRPSITRSVQYFSVLAHEAACLKQGHTQPLYHTTFPREHASCAVCHPVFIAALLRGWCKFYGPEGYIVQALCQIYSALSVKLPSDRRRQGLRHRQTEGPSLWFWWGLPPQDGASQLAEANRRWSTQWPSFTSHFPRLNHTWKAGHHSVYSLK